MAGSDSAGDAGFRPWHFFVLASLVAATVAVMRSGHPHPVQLLLISLTIAAAGLAGLAVYRTFAPLALDEAHGPFEPLGLRARAGLEREKMLALRSIKELEFDRAMGKVSEGDFEEMASRLRARAIALMKQLDDSGGGYRQIVEQELRARLGRAGITPATPPAAAAAADTGAVTPRCSSCGTMNDGDAKFCKQCGRPLADA